MANTAHVSNAHSKDEYVCVQGYNIRRQGTLAQCNETAKSLIGQTPAPMVTTLANWTASYARAILRNNPPPALENQAPQPPAGPAPEKKKGMVEWLKGAVQPKRSARIEWRAEPPLPEPPAQPVTVQAGQPLVAMPAFDPAELAADIETLRRAGYAKWSGIIQRAIAHPDRGLSAAEIAFIKRSVAKVKGKAALTGAWQVVNKGKQVFVGSHEDACTFAKTNGGAISRQRSEAGEIDAMAGLGAFILMVIAWLVVMLALPTHSLMAVTQALQNLP